MFKNKYSNTIIVKPHPARSVKNPRSNGWFSGVLLFGLLLISLTLLVLSKSENRQLAKWQARAIDLVAPALEITTLPAGYVQRSINRLQGFYDVNRKLARLRLENKRLRNIKWNVEHLQRTNARLKALLNSARDARLKIVSGRVISGNPGLFGQHMLINVGRRNGIGSGFAVINADGFVGRTIDTGEQTSRILLLTDKTSRIPVTIGRQEVRAIAVGTGSRFPRIDFLPQGSTIYEGDFVYTSGQGGDLPRGLRIGVVRKSGKEYHIALSARQEGTDYVSVLYFDQTGLASQ